MFDKDIDGEVQFWSTTLICHILVANPPTNVKIGFVNRVWGAYGVDRITILDNGLFLVRFKTQDQQQIFLNNGHLIFDNKPVVVREWNSDMKIR